MASRHKCVLQQNRPAGRGTLAETRPVIDNAHPRRDALHKGKLRFAALIGRCDRHQVREQRAAAIKLLAVYDIAVPVGTYLRFKMADGFTALFGERIAEAHTF